MAHRRFIALFVLALTATFALADMSAADSGSPGTVGRPSDLPREALAAGITDSAVPAGRPQFGDPSSASPAGLAQLGDASATPPAGLIQFGGAMTAVEMHGDLLFVGEGTRLVVYRDVPGQGPRRLARGEPGLRAVTAIEVADDGGSVWVAAANDAVRGYTVGEDGTLELLVRFEPPGPVVGMALEVDRLWLACRVAGVAVYTLEGLAQGRAPRLLARATHMAPAPPDPESTPQIASINDVEVAGGRVAAVGGPDLRLEGLGALMAVKMWISQIGSPPPDTFVPAPRTPTQGASPTPSPSPSPTATATPTPRASPTRSPPPKYGFALSIGLEESSEPGSDGASRIRLADAVAFPGSAVAADVAAPHAGAGRESGTVLWSSGPGGALQAVEVLAGGELRTLGRLRETDDLDGGAGALPRALALDGGWAHVVDSGRPRGLDEGVEEAPTTAGLWNAQASASGLPTLRGILPVVAPRAVAARAGRVWLAAEQVLRGYERTRDGRLVPLRGGSVVLEAPLRPKQVLVHENVAWLADDLGLVALSLAADGAAAPRRGPSLQVAEPIAMAAAGRRLYALDKDGMLHTFDIGDHRSPRRMATLRLPLAEGVGYALSAAASDRWLVLLTMPETDFTISMTAFRLGMDGLPREQSAGGSQRTIELRGAGWPSMHVQGDSLWLAAGGALGLQRYRLDEAGPLLAASLAAPPDLRDMAFDGAHLLLLDGQLGLLVLDIDDPERPRTVGQLDLRPPVPGADPWAITAARGHAWVGYRTPDSWIMGSWVQPYDLRVPEFPAEEGTSMRIPNSEHVFGRSAAAAPGALVVAGGDAGVLVIPAERMPPPIPARPRPPTRPPVATATAVIAPPPSVVPPVPSATRTPTSTPTLRPTPPPPGGGAGGAGRIVLPWLLGGAAPAAE